MNYKEERYTKKWKLLYYLGTLHLQIIKLFYVYNNLQSNVIRQN